MDVMSQALAILRNDSGVSTEYAHGPKFVSPGDRLATSGAILKWYGLYPADRPIPPEITDLARAFLENTALEAAGFGFVILHRCGGDFYFLLVSTWRNNNELWETVFYKDGDAMNNFALFPREETHKPNYCVWELVPLWHEQKAWERFLNSTRDDVAVQSWLNDHYAGVA